MELQFFFSARHLMVVCICTKFHENILNGIKISKGHNSIKNVGGDMIHFLCTLSDDGLYLYKVS